MPECNRALDSAGEVCPSCFNIHPPRPEQREDQAMPDEIRRGKQYEQDQPEPADWPVAQIRFYQDAEPNWTADETWKTIKEWPGYGKTAALDAIIRDLMAGRKAELLDLKEEREYENPRRWAYGDRVWDGTSYTWPRRGYSALDFKLRDPDCAELPVRVGDVVRIIDLMPTDVKPFPGHVVDIDGWWITVASRLGRHKFYGQTGYQAGNYRWRLEPYITEEESNR